MAQSFIEYIKESEELLEAVVPEMHKFFNRQEIQEIGKKLSKLGISMQSSDIQAWGAKGFRLKAAKEHRVHILKIKNTRGYVMLYYVNARSADIIDNTTGLELSNAKEAYAKADQVFTFNTVVDTKKIREQRWNNAHNFMDPLVRNQNSREMRLDNLKYYKNRANISKEYAKTLVRDLARVGVWMVNPRVEDGEFYADEMSAMDMGKYVHRELVQSALEGRPRLKILIKRQDFHDADAIKSLINELNYCLQTDEALRKIDLRKLETK